MKLELSVTPAENGSRLDTFIAAHLTVLSRSKTQEMIARGRAAVNGEICLSKSFRLSPGDRVTFVPLSGDGTPELSPEPVPLDILFEDGDLLVINKPRGMVVHPGPGHCSGTLVNALLHHCRELSTRGGPLRPGIVHRLDKDTSGLLLAAKNDFTHQELSRQFKARLVGREYLALVHGKIPAPGGRISAPLGRHPRHRQKMAVAPGGREAITRYRVLAYRGNFTLLRVFLHTGRTHQVRVHLAYLGHPVVGDPVYGPKNRQKLPPEFQEGQALHARRVKLTHPRSGEPLSFLAPLPDYFQKGLRDL